MPGSRVMESLMRWKAGKRKTDVQLPQEGSRDPRLPPEPDAIDRQLTELDKRRRILGRLAQP